MALAIQLRQDARESKDWPAADIVRDTLAAAGIALQDGRDASGWELLPGADETAACGAIVDMVVARRIAARERSEWAAADALRDALAGAGVQLLDAHADTTWEWSEAERAPTSLNREWTAHKQWSPER